MAAKPAPLKASAAPKAVSKSVPAKIASPSRVVNTTMKTVRDDAGTMKLAPKTTVVAKPSVNAPLKAGSAPKAAPKPVQTSTVPQGLKPTDLTTLIQQNLNRPGLQPIGSNAPLNLYKDRGATAAAELARAQAAHRTLMDSIKLKEQQAAAAKAAQAAAMAPKPQPVVQPVPQPAPQPAPVIAQPVPQPAPVPALTPPPGYSLNKPVTAPAQTVTQMPVAPVVPTPTPVVNPPAMDYSQYKLPTGWGFKAPTATAVKP